MKKFIDRFYRAGGFVKPNEDFADFAAEIGWEILPFYVLNQQNWDMEHKKEAFATAVRAVEPGDLYIHQFPGIFPSADEYTEYLQALRARQAICGVMVNDIPNWLSAGWPDGSFPERYVQRFDFMIVHTKAMKQKFRDLGYKKPIFLNSLYDYKNAYPILEKKFERVVFSAGNLLKSMNLSEWKNDTKLVVYDSSFTEGEWWPKILKQMETNGVELRDNVPSDELTKALTKGFGLVTQSDYQHEGIWDQYSATYAHINAPYKLSLYLSNGFPVIVDSFLSSAKFIVKHKLGYAVDNIDQIDELMAQVTEESYAEMAGNARKFAELMRNGYFTKRVLSQVEGYRFK